MQTDSCSKALQHEKVDFSFPVVHKILCQHNLQPVHRVPTYKGLIYLSQKRCLHLLIQWWRQSVCFYSILGLVFLQFGSSTQKGGGLKSHLHSVWAEFVCSSHDLFPPTACALRCVGTPSRLYPAFRTRPFCVPKQDNCFCTDGSFFLGGVIFWQKKFKRNKNISWCFFYKNNKKPVLLRCYWWLQGDALKTLLIFFFRFAFNKLVQLHQNLEPIFIPDETYTQHPGAVVYCKSWCSMM